MNSDPMRGQKHLWIDEGEEGMLFSNTFCSGLHTLDLVLFYYILSGFTMYWGYLDRA